MTNKPTLRERIAEIFYGGAIPHDVDWNEFDHYLDWRRVVNKSYEKADQILNLLKEELEGLTEARLSPLEDSSLYSFKDGTRTQLSHTIKELKERLGG